LVKREVIDIDHEKCDGCGECIPACPEGAIQLIDGKARLVNEAFCDGLGACLGECPQDAIKITEKEASPYNEKKVVENMVRQGRDVLKAHLKHLKEHGQNQLYQEAIQHLDKLGIKPPEIKTEKTVDKEKTGKQDVERQEKPLGQWPVQLSLVPVQAPYFDTDELLFIADCVPTAHPDFHREITKGRPIVIGCPKLDDQERYIEKLTEILSANPIKKISSVHMEVPCCYGTNNIIKKAIENTDKEVDFEEKTISIEGNTI